MMRNVRSTAIQRSILVMVAVALAATAAYSVSQQGSKQSSDTIAREYRASGPTLSLRLSQPESGVITGATVQRNPSTGRIARVRGETPVPGARTPREAADRYLRTYARVLGIAPNLRDVQAFFHNTSLTGDHLRYQQVVNGLPVIGATISVHVNKRLAVVRVNNGTVSIKAKAPAARFDNRNGALGAALAALNVPGAPMAAPTASPAIYNDSSRPVPVWLVHIETREPAGSWEILVRESDLKVLRIVNRARFVDGDGMVFVPNPVTTSGQANLTDDNDADSPALNNERVAVKLKDLDGSGFLQGPFCSTAPTDMQPRANEPSLTYNYLRSDDRFEEVMCYYHIDTSQRYIQSLGFTNVNNRVQGMNANGSTADNAWYSPGTGNILTGSGGVDDAEDAHVILHEYGHSIQDNQVPGWGAAHEGGSMGEGFGDYWGVTSFTGIGPNSPAWDVYVATWDAVSYNPGDPAYLRRLDSPKHYPEDMTGEVHADGEIWSACLWQIRDIVGATRADTMILESHFYLSPDAGFVDGATAILDANEALYSGADQDAILQVFVDRGILVDQRITKLSAAYLPCSAGQSVMLSAVLTRVYNGSPVEGKDITFSVAGTVIGIATTDANGLAEQAYTIPLATPPGDIPYEAVFDGDADANASSANAALYVIKLSSIAGSVTDSGAPMNGVTVTGVLAPPTFAAAPNLMIPDDSPAGVEAVAVMRNSGLVGSVEVSVNIQHPSIGDLKIGLIHPDGTMVLLHNEEGGSSDNINTTYPTLTPPAESLDALIGKPLGGPWRLWIADGYPLDAGVLKTWSVKITPQAPLTATATTGPTGSYALNSLEPGTWRLDASQGSSAFAPRSLDVLVPPDKTDANFALDSFTIAGQVTRGGLPLPDTEIILTSPADKTLYVESAPGAPIPDNDTTGIESPIEITEQGTVQSLSVGVQITHPYKGDLEVSLIHPDGTRIRLHNRTGGAGDDIYTTYPDDTTPVEPLSALAGKPVQGVWKLRVRDLALADSGTLNAWSLSLAYRGTTDRTTTTDADGRYAFADCLSGTHTVTPVKAGHPFEPHHSTVVVGPHQLSVDFVSMAQSSSVTVDPATGPIDGSAVLSATLKDSAQQPIAGKTISFSVDGTAAGDGVTDGNGVATAGFVVPVSYALGDHPVQADFAGSIPYMPSSGTGVLTVTPGETRVYGLNRSGAEGDGIDLRAYLMTLNSLTPIEGRNIAFNVNGTDLGEVATDATGRASLAYTVPGPDGAYPMTFTFAGDASFNGSQGQATLTVSASATQMTMADHTGRIGGSVTLKAYLLTDPSNKPVNGRTVDFTVEGTVVGSAVTNASGRALHAYAIADGVGAGVRAIGAVFAGTGGYTGSSASATLTVSKAQVYIWPYARSIRAGSPAALRAYVRRLGDYEWLTGRTIDFSVEGTAVGSATTDGAGIAWFTYSGASGLGTGIYSFTAAFAGDAWVEAGSANGTFKIVP